MGAGASSTSTDTEWSDQRDRMRQSPQKKDTEIRYRHVRHGAPSSYWIDSLVLLRARCTAPIHSFLDYFNQILIQSHGPHGPVKREILRIEFQKFPGPRPGIEPGTSGSTTQRFSTLSYHSAVWQCRQSMDIARCVFHGTSTHNLVFW